MGKAHFESGGIAMARAKRAEYISNPNICLGCKGPILPKEGQKLADARKKKFCSRSCNGSYSTPEREKHKEKLVATGKAVKKHVPCLSCGKNANTGDGMNRRKYCVECNAANKTALMSVLKKDSTHAKIRSHARTIAKRHCGNACLHCGYDTFIEVCHVKPVRDFLPISTLGEINDPENLIILCRTHHWEFDHGLLFYDRAKKILTREPALD
jgi:hypothetical protein